MSDNMNIDPEGFDPDEVIGPSDLEPGGVIGPSDLEPGGVIGPSDLEPGGIVAPTDNQSLDPSRIPPPSPDQPIPPPSPVQPIPPPSPVQPIPPPSPIQPKGPGFLGTIRGILIGLLLPAVLVGAVLITPFINGDTYPPDPMLRPFVDTSCWARLRFPDIMREFYTPIVCNFYTGGFVPPVFPPAPGPNCGQSCTTDRDCTGGTACTTFEYSWTGMPCGGASDCTCENNSVCYGPDIEACGLACDLAVGALCPEGFDCISGTCQNNAVCLNACGQTCTTDADCPGGLSCIEDRGLYGVDAPSGVFFCFNTAVCTNPGGVSACGMACDEAIGATCPGDLECMSGTCQNSRVCLACGNGVCDTTETTASCPADCPAVTTACNLTNTCGDGVCEAACETDQTCPQDCAVGSASEGGEGEPASSGPACGSPCTADADCVGLGVNPACAGGFCYDAQTCDTSGASGSDGSDNSGSGGNNNGGGAVCGNGVVEKGEACDGNQNGSCDWNKQYCTNSCSCDTLE